MAGQTIRVAVSDEVPVIATDRWLLRRVLNNLVVNAIRHSGGTEAIDLRAEYSGETVRLQVHDTGRGISAEEQATLFTKQGRRRRREQSHEDTGLGLVFCKMAVEVLGGSIGVTSTPGAGATFTVALPVTAPG
jgi:signal transduction histidine kinase